jgi:hypothetical protein
MNRERHVEVLRGGEDPVVPGVSVWGTRGERERAHEGAAAAIGDGALELLGRRGGIAQRQVRDGDQSPAGVAAESAIHRLYARQYAADSSGSINSASHRSPIVG